VAWGWWWTTPHPWTGVGVELAGRHPGGQGDFVRGGKRLAGEGFAAKQPPPALLEIQPAGPFGDEGMLDAGWSASQAGVEALVWLERLSVITMMVPAGLAVSTAASSCW
jgi:hypothetical protein